MSKSQRDKGKRAEREVAEILRGQGFNARRGVQYHGGPDSPDVVGVPGIHLEVCHAAVMRLPDKLRQAVSDAAPGEVPAVVHKVNRGEWCVTIRLCDAPAFAQWYNTGTSRPAVPISEMLP